MTTRRKEIVAKMSPSPENRYLRLLERIFLSRYEKGAREVVFHREDIVRTGGLTSAVHEPKDIDQTLAALEPALAQMKAEGAL